jgi:hypothetical protein
VGTSENLFITGISMDRIQIIRQLCVKRYRKRPTAEKILAVIYQNGLNRYTSEGKIRPKNALIEAMAKALNTL